MTRVVFMGTPEFAVPTLHALIESSQYNVVGVVTQPDRPAGRGRSLRPSPIKIAALEASIPIFQPPTLRTPEAFAQLETRQPDLIVVAAFGQILRQNVLDLPTFGCINVHASLLPRWRGAAPIQAAIRAGDTDSGITIMIMDAGLDTGPMLSHRTIQINADDTGQSLHDRLAEIGGPLLLKTLSAYLEGSLTPRPQPDDDSLITYANQIRKEDGQIEWTSSAAEIDRLVRAFTPWPGTFTYWDGKLLKILSGTFAAGRVAPGQVVATEHGFAVGTSSGMYIPEAVQLAGKKAVSAADFVRGNNAIIGTSLGQ
jgi:methionyl-tRNA formyltransferase